MGTMQRALVLGGTQFLGVHVVERLLDAGYDVTLSNRGETNPEAFPHLQTLLADRDSNMACLEGSAWDVIYDLSGHEPEHIAKVANHVNNDARYIFVSTINVYADTSGTDPITENSIVFTTPFDEVDPESMDAYGQLKALAEAEVRAHFPQHHVVRPGVICGPGDPSDRLTYWATRFAESGPHIVPEAQEVSLQFIDVRDLAGWLVSLGSEPHSGTYNAVAPRTTLSAFLSEIERISGSSVERVALSESAMKKHEVMPWVQIPMWLPTSDTGKQAFFNIDASDATRRGLMTRRSPDTIQAILEWADGERLKTEPRYGLSSDQETDLIAVLRNE
ncbi:NAD-dependent epimerase/dehydratase family protein [Brevibacterium antiquum]|uniref:2'-hydroxyisoflavone reductase n=1 Tax=Brevibacterium antiquum TaxID=234835 RepID=A0A2H1KTD2_9MICO|nr:NAD-dependent epimerase/dehydratase family protein [Brevibacterium antiquum]SMY03026.1 2'-hydroxyisoflavone reductase [Brevibacterium antiquum]